MRRVVVVLIAISAFLTVRAESASVVQKEFTMKKSPSTAILYSLACPGLGQVYTEKYWKAPLFAGIAGGCIYGIISNNSSFVERSNASDAAVAAGKTALEISLLRRQREFYRDQRDLSGLFLIITYIAATIDAYADAHLYDFNVSENISIHISPSYKGNGVSIALMW